MLYLRSYNVEEPLPYLLDLTETYGAPVILTNMGTIQLGAMQIILG